MTEEDRLAEETEFQKKYAKQIEIAKKVLFWTFFGMGVVFAVVGACLSYLGESEDDRIVGFVFMILGGVFAVVGGLTTLIKFKQMTYQQYKDKFLNYSNTMTSGYYDFSILLQMQEKRITSLEEETANLKRRIEELEERNR